MKREHYAVIFGVALLLLSLAWNTKPIGYLHSWNQVTTLTHISAVARDFSSWSKPYDVVTRLPAPGKQIVVAEPFEDFRIYEELPLYHVASALLARLGRAAEPLAQLLALENSARIVSLFFWGVGAAGIYRLGALGGCSLVATISLMLYCCSFPVAYYGVAIMSDIAMASMWTWSLVYVARRRQGFPFSNSILALLCAGLAGMFKSYGLIALLPPLAAELYNARRRTTPNHCRGLLVAVALAVCAATPTLAWHAYAAINPGHQEIESHSLALKLSTVASFSFWNSLQKYFFRYLSYGGGGLVVLASILWFRTRHSHKLPTYLASASLAAALFLLATADKISHHDYYFLMPAIPLFICSAHILRCVIIKLPTHTHTAALCALCICIATPSFLNLKKALREHADVIPCAELAAAQTRSDQLTAAYSDVTRYNSITYYAGRFAVRVEETAFPIRRYRDAGASSLIIDLPPAQYEGFQEWLHKQRATSLIAQIRSVDYKGQPRVCGVYRFD